MSTKRIVVIGAGVGGLVTALDLARQGVEVVVVEKAERAGGKLREVPVGDARIDGGPTIFTMTWVLEELFADAGASLADYLKMERAEILARHAWSATERLDLYADVERSADAVGQLAGADEARRFRAFSAHAKSVFETLEVPFLRSSRPNPISLATRIGFGRYREILQIKPYISMWRLLENYFQDPRLRSLFGRFTTYVGASPLQAPATFLLMAQVEQSGIWLVEGGMYQIAKALVRLAEERGVSFQYGAEATEIHVEQGRAAAVSLANGERLAADAVVLNGDVAALAAGLFGKAASGACAPVSLAERSLSLMAWTIKARTEGFPLVRHSYFYSDDYPAEFRDVFERQRLPEGPTVYVCAQDRNDREGSGPSGPERLLCLTYAPPTGDTQRFDAAEIERFEELTFSRLAQFGLEVHRQPEATVLTTPDKLQRAFPGTGGAVYGRAAHGILSNFIRPTSRSKIPGLYLAGGTTHPGPGVPMAALSGRLAAATLMQDLTATKGARGMVTLGKRAT